MTRRDELVIEISRLTNERRGLVEYGMRVIKRANEHFDTAAVPLMRELAKIQKKEVHARKVSQIKNLTGLTVEEVEYFRELERKVNA